ncbi:MAG: hypothetical protein JNJ43_12610, partial [Anaerolineales bacterium]|nr:hypothetical protein [Anaerolineales bacterium]
ALTNIFGPIIAGVSFELINFSSPYWIGSLFALSALGIAYLGLRRQTADD